MKKLFIYTVLSVGAIALVYIYDYATKVKQPVPVEYFKQGQILLPDYACPDTLVVIDAPGLNEAMALIEQGIIGDDYGDAAYDSLFHLYCVQYYNNGDLLFPGSYPNGISIPDTLIVKDAATLNTSFINSFGSAGYEDYEDIIYSSCFVKP